MCVHNFNSQIHVWFPLHLLVCRVHRLWSFLATFWSGFRTHYFQSVPIGSLHGARPLGYLLDGCPVEAGFWTWGSCLKAIYIYHIFIQNLFFKKTSALWDLPESLDTYHLSCWKALKLGKSHGMWWSAMQNPLCIAIFVPKIALPFTNVPVFACIVTHSRISCPQKTHWCHRLSARLFFSIITRHSLDPFGKESRAAYAKKKTSKPSVSYVIRILKRSEISKLCFIFRLQQLCCRELGPRTRMRCKFPAACTEEGCSVATWQNGDGIRINNQASSNAFTRIQLELNKIHKFAGTGCFCFNGSSFSQLVCWNLFFCHFPSTFSI